LRHIPGRTVRSAAVIAVAICAAVSTAASFANPIRPSTSPPATIIGDRIFLREYAAVAPGRFSESGLSIGKIIHTADGGQIFGFSVDENGDDGLLASAQDTGSGVKASVETFSQSTGTITKVIARTNTMDDFVDLGIAAGDVGLIEHEHVTGFLKVTRSFHILNPVTGNAFTGLWTPPSRSNLLVEQIADNQSTTQAAVFGITKSTDAPRLFASNIAANTFGPVFRLNPNLYGLADGPQLAEDVATGQAVFGLSPDGGSVGGSPPDIEMIDLSTGKQTGFQGVRIPPFNSGFVNGLAVDSTTGIACTTTELDASVEFYVLATGAGTAVQLPGSNGNQFNSGEGVAVDPIHHLFFVIQPNGTVGPPGSVVDIFDEHGNLQTSITGFTAFSVTPELAVNPNTRVGFVSGPTSDAITEFAY